MAGILSGQPPEEDVPPPPDGATPETPPAAEGSADTAVTAELRDKIMESAPPELREPIERIVTAGKRLMYDPETHELMLQQLQDMKGGNEADSLAQGIAALMTLIKNESKGPFPLPALVPAAVILLCEAVDFLAEAGRLEPSKELVGQAVEELTGYLMKKMQIGPEQIAAARQAGQKGGPAPEPAAPPNAPPGPAGQAPRGILGGA